MTKLQQMSGLVGWRAGGTLARPAVIAVGSTAACVLVLGLWLSASVARAVGESGIDVGGLYGSIWSSVLLGCALLATSLFIAARSAARRLRDRNEELERERALTDGVMASMGQGLLVLTPDQSIRYGNEQASRLLGLEDDGLQRGKLEAALNRSPLVTGTRESALRRWRDASARIAERPTVELAIDDVVRRDVALELFLVDEQEPGSDIGVLVRDVTSERELERTKDELVSVVSHELRTPLSALVGFADLMYSKDFPPARQREFLGVMVQEGHRLTGLINDFLDLQRMESGVAHMTSRRVDLAELIQTIPDRVGLDDKHPLEISVSSTLPVLRADPERLSQVIMNLVSNAQKYSPDGGAISLSAAVIDGQVKVGVTDHGLGLPPDALQRLFAKFYRVDNSDRRAIKGTGLGLAICQRIITSHGGHIWAESDGLGKGSSFYFTLPIERLTAQERDVLIVEDDAGFGRLLKVELSALGRSAAHVSSAAEAMELLKVAKPSALVLASQLPGTSAEELLRWLPADFASKVPVIVVSNGAVEKRDRARLAVLGVQELFVKSPATAHAAAEWVATRLSEMERERSPRGAARAA